MELPAHHDWVNVTMLRTPGFVLTPAKIIYLVDWTGHIWLIWCTRSPHKLLYCHSCRSRSMHPSLRSLRSRVKRKLQSTSEAGRRTAWKNDWSVGIPSVHDDLCSIAGTWGAEPSSAVGNFLHKNWLSTIAHVWVKKTVVIMHLFLLF